MSIKASPYDWQHPVTVPSLFAGRKKELEKIESEILKLTGSPPIAPFIAIVGVRRVGKTSLMNMVSLMCKKHKILTPRIRLDTAVAKDPWAFWFAIYTALKNEIGDVATIRPDQSMVYGQVTISPGDIQEHNKDPWAQLKFPGLYNNRPSGSNIPPLSTIIESDLRVICEYLSLQKYCGVNVMIDEAQILNDNLLVREQLRNTLQNLNIIGLTLVGLPQLNGLFSKVEEPFYGQIFVIHDPTPVHSPA